MLVTDLAAAMAVILLVALVIGNLLALKARGIQAVMLGRQPGWGGYLAWLILLVAGVSLTEILLHAWQAPVHLIPMNSTRVFFHLPLIRLLGAALMLTAVSVLAAALVAMGQSYRIGGIDTQRPGRLVTRGIFRFSRNPIYLAVDLFYLGAFLVYSTTFFLSLALGTFICLHLMILREERFLQTRHDAAYMAYCQQVRRYF